VSRDVSDKLSRFIPVEELLRVYAQAQADVVAGFALLKKAETDMDEVFKLDDIGGSFHAYCGHSAIRADPTDTLIHMKRETWGRIVDRLEIRRMLSVKRANELDKQLRDGDLPELTLNAVVEFVEFYQEQGPQMLKEAVDEVFSFLRPRGSDYKTNTEFEIGERAILSGWVCVNWIGTGYRPSDYRGAEFIALDNVFSMLDGRGTIAKTWRGELADAVEKSGPRGVGETRYFAFKCFRKRTFHLRFKRLDLLKKLNMIAGGMNLKPVQAAQNGLG
jgi:hypothetical protein